MAKKLKKGSIPRHICFSRSSLAKSNLSNKFLIIELNLELLTLSTRKGQLNQRLKKKTKKNIFVNKIKNN